MNTQKLISILLLTIFATTNIYSENIVCINCVAKIKNNQDTNNDNNFKAFKIAYNTQNQDDPNYILPLDENNDNDEITTETNNITDIILKDESIEEDDTTILTNEIIYACEDIEMQTLICDNINKICECV